jgi:hypothetical protein
MKTRTGLAMVVAMLLAGAGMVHAGTLNDTSLTDGSMTLTGEPGSYNAFKGSGGNANVFNWNDKDGDGIVEGGDADTVTPGLAMNSRSLTGKTSGVGFQLTNIGGEVSHTTGGGLYAYTGNHVDGGPITISGATHIALKEIWTRAGNANGGNINVTHSGNMTLAADVDSTSTGFTAGSQTFTGGGSAVGHFQAHGSLKANAPYAGTITIQRYNQATVDGNIDTSMTSGGAWAHSAKHIRILNIGSGGITVSGNMTANRSVGNSGMNAGSFLFSTTGPIHIRGTMTSQGTSSSALGGAGNIDFDAGSQITIVGAIDLDDASSSSQEGYAVLTTTGGEGYTIVIGDEDNPGNKTLNFGVINYIQFESFTGESVIYQTISGFSGNNSTQFRVGTAGHKIYYYHDETVNTALRAGGTDGVYNIGGSGTLEPIPEPPKGTVIIVK